MDSPAHSYSVCRVGINSTLMGLHMMIYKWVVEGPASHWVSTHGGQQPDAETSRLDQSMMETRYGKPLPIRSRPRTRLVRPIDESDGEAGMTISDVPDAV